MEYGDSRMPKEIVAWKEWSCPIKGCEEIIYNTGQESEAKRKKHLYSHGLSIALPGNKGGNTGTQLSNQALQAMLRAHIPGAVEALVEMANDKRNPNVRLGAVKTIMAKVLPDLRSTELTSEDGVKFLLEIVQDNRLKDANTKDPIALEALPGPGDDILIADEIQDSIKG